MISGSSDDTLRLWNMSTYQIITVIEGIKCCFINGLYQIDSDRVIVGGFHAFCIVNIDNCIIEQTIRDGGFIHIRCFLKLRDNNTILFGCNDGLFCFL